jgi:glycosyltransferase involved in cell wall biosynthesis
MARILITSTQYPYYGGAATNAYALVKYLRFNGHKVAGIFFDNHNKNVDPDGVGGVWRCNIKSASSKHLTKRIVTSYLGGLPDTILGKNYAAPVHSKDLFPNAKIIYLVTGSPHMIDLSKKGISANVYIKSKEKKVFTPEERCIAKSDLIVPNSKIARDMLVKNYGNLSKITHPIDTSMAFNRKQTNNVNFMRRNFSIAFICSNLERSVKNPGLASKILSNKDIIKNNNIVIGGNDKSFKKIRGVKTMGVINHSRVLKIMSDTKLVICTSYYDASPNIIKEALISGCNILVSKNCGWSETYPNAFVCNDIYDINEWINKSKYLINKNIAINLDKNSKLLSTNINGLLK